MAVVADPLATTELDKAYTAGIKSRRQAEAPITGRTELAAITGIDEVTDANGALTFQCVYCGKLFGTVVSARPHLGTHSDSVRSGDKARSAREKYAPEDTAAETLLELVRHFEVVTPTLRQAARDMVAAGKRQQSPNGKTAVPKDELEVLRAKAKAYDQLKAETLKSKFPV